MVPRRWWRWQSMRKGLVLGGLLTTFMMLLYRTSMSPTCYYSYIQRMKVPGSCSHQSTRAQGQSFTNLSHSGPKKDRSCMPKKDIMFLKTHKTASSTLLNILFRFGEKHQLKFAFPDSRNDFLYPEPFHRLHVKGYQPGMCYNIVCNHMRFNRLEVARVLPPGAAYITILRDPAELFESAFHYFNSLVPLTWMIPGKDKLAKFLRDPWHYYQHNSYNSFYLKNLLFFDLGYDNALQPDDVQVEQAIQAVEKSFHLVMMAEHFEESLILLKDILCWDLEDLLFLRLNVRRSSSVSKLSPWQRTRALEWNSIDWILYRHFNATFWAKVEAYGTERMAMEVAKLRQQNAEMTDLCVEGGRPVEAGSIRDVTLQPWQPFGQRSIMGYNLRKDIDPSNTEICRKMLSPELQYMSELGVNLWATRLWGRMVDLISW